MKSKEEVIGLGRVSKILTEEQEKRLNDFLWALEAIDRQLDKTGSLFQRLISLEGSKANLIKKYEETITFKIKQIYHLLLSIEENIHSSSFDFYKQYYGIFKNSNKYLEIKGLTLSYQFETFLMQTKTLIDIFLKFIWEFKLQNTIGKIDSFEKISNKMETLLLGDKNSNKYKKAKDTIEKLKKTGFLKHFFNNYESFYSLKNYRDYIIHRGVIRQEKSVSKANERYIQYEYWLPSLKKSGDNYDINPNLQQRLEYFCKLKFLEILSAINETLLLLIDPEIIKKVKEDIKNTSPETVKTVLLNVAKKGIWADKILLNEQQLREYLEGRGYKGRDLIVDFIEEEKIDKSLKSYDNKDMSSILERTYFKPLDYVNIYKIKHKYSKDYPLKNPYSLDETYSIVDFSFSIKEIAYDSEEIKKLIDNLIILGKIIRLYKEDERYLLIDEDLKILIATLRNLAQFKWTFIQHPQMSYFRKRKSSEIKNTKEILGADAENYMKKEDIERKKIQLEYKDYNKRQKEWKLFRKKHKLEVKNFSPSDINYKKIRENINSSPMSEIIDTWQKEYYGDGYIRLADKDGKIVDGIDLLDYLHQLNTNFKDWKEKFDSKKFNEIKKICRKEFHRRKEHYLDLRKRWLEASKKKYLQMIAEEKERFKEIIPKYSYLRLALKLINNDLYIKKIDLS